MPSFALPALRRRVRALAFALLALAAACVYAPASPVHAQSFDATHLLQPTDLGVTWLVKGGDNPAWAQPDFDDSQWIRVDPHQSLKSYLPTHPGIVWYRLHVKVAPNQLGLALSEYSLASAFEIYVNGQKLLETGSVAPYHPYTFAGRLLHRIPDAAIATGSVLIALRVRISSNDWTGPFPGYYPSNLTLGQQSALSDHIWLLTIGQNALTWFYWAAGFGLGVIAIALYSAQRQQREYLWIFLLFLSAALGAPLQLELLFHNLPAWTAYLDACVSIAEVVFQTLMFLAFLRIPVRRWIQVWLVLAAAGVLFQAWQTSHGSGSSIGLLAAVTPELSLLAGVIPFLLLLHARRGNREAAILLVPAVIISLTTYLQLTAFLLMLIPRFEVSTTDMMMAISNMKFGPFTVNLFGLDNCLFVLTLAIILVLRSTRIAAQQVHIETELAAAREVQQILVPETVEQTPGFAIESAYEPAQQVGGDFFQIIPAADGSLLIVIGDVAGKGLPAAMLVSVLVGAIRAVADYTTDPAELLANLNQRLVGRVGSNFATALAARIEGNGAVVLANAGHLPPYLDGRELDIPGALPLGAKSDTHYQTVRFTLPMGARLTVYSDGIVEAQNAAGELFGFDRTRGIATQPVARIIEAARRFGQQDDMTVIAVTRTPIPVPAPTPAAVVPNFGFAAS